MALRRLSLRQLVNILLIVPATVIFSPLCVYLFVYYIYAALAVVISSPSRVSSETVVALVAMPSLCIGAMTGLVALWTLIWLGDAIRHLSAGMRRMLRKGLWIGCVACAGAAAWALYAVWRGGFFPAYSLFLTVAGPLVVFFRERRELSANDRGAR